MSRRTFVVLIVAFALLAIATTVRSGWLYLVSSMLLATIPVGLLSGWRATRRLEVERECPAEVFEGEPFQVKLKVMNSGRMGRYLVSFRDRQFGGGNGGGMMGELRRRRAELKAFVRAEGADAVGGPRTPVHAKAPRGEATISVDSLPAGEAVEAAYELVAPRRGIFEEAELTVSSGGVFGGVSMKRRMLVPSRLTVFPAVSPIDFFPFDPVVSVALAESYEWGRKGMGQDYYGVREYVHGDSLRHIHWRSSARQGKLIVKEYQQEFMPTAGLLLLLGLPHHGDARVNSLEDGLRAAASILDYYTGMGSVPRLIVPRDGGFEFVERETLHGCLEVLAGYEPPSGRMGTDAGGDRSLLPRAVYFAREMLGQGRSLTVVTNAPVGEVARSLGGMNGAEEVSLVLVVEESYRPGWDERRAAQVTEEVGRGARGRPDKLYFLTRGAEIGRCLSEPLNTTAA